MSLEDAVKIGDELSRLVKLAVDSGEAATLEEAQAIFARYRVGVIVGPQVARSATHQATLLTVVNCARRAMPGGVEVIGLANQPLLLPVAGPQDLREAVTGLGGTPRDHLPPDIPTITIGGDGLVDRPFAVCTTFDGWRGAVVPVASSTRLPQVHEFTLAGILAGALAVSEAFQYLRGSNPAAGMRDVGMSLWRPDVPWNEPSAVGPAVTLLPAKLWLIGLGNLGQAYLWALSLLPYAEPDRVDLFLHDFDVLAKSNDSTSLLTSLPLVGQRKSRAMAASCERRGFRTTIIERPFAANFRVAPDEPPVALCGVDNALARAQLEQVGFKRIIEAGLGAGVQDYLALRVHTFPGAREASTIWRDTDQEPVHVRHQPAYKALEASGIDECGLTHLAGRSVGAPFVGAVAGCMVIAEALRLAGGFHRYDLIDATLRAPDLLVAHAARADSAFNPSSAKARPV